MGWSRVVPSNLSYHERQKLRLLDSVCLVREPVSENSKSPVCNPSIWTDPISVTLVEKKAFHVCLQPDLAPAEVLKRSLLWPDCQILEMRDFAQGKKKPSERGPSHTVSPWILTDPLAVLPAVQNS